MKDIESYLPIIAILILSAFRWIIRFSLYRT